MSALRVRWECDHVTARETVLQKIKYIIEYLNLDCIGIIARLFIGALAPNYPIVYDSMFVKGQCWTAPFIDSDSPNYDISRVIEASFDAIASREFEGTLTKHVSQCNIAFVEPVWPSSTRDLTIKLYIGYIMKRADITHTHNQYAHMNNYTTAFVGRRVMGYASYRDTVLLPLWYRRSIEEVNEIVDSALRGPLHVMVKLA